MKAAHLVNRLLEADEDKIDWSPDPEAEPIPSNFERWVFAAHEFPRVCKRDDRLVAQIYDDDNIYLGNVVVLRNGAVMDYDTDGNKVNADMQRRASIAIHSRDNESGYKYWRDVVVDKNGKFLGFAGH